MEVAIGIDLGTTNCCMAYVKGDKPVIIPNRNGSYTTPSYIGFVKNEIVFGKTAMSRKVQNTDNTIYDVKRFIGRNFKDPFVQKFTNRWKFKLIDNNGQIMVKVKNDVVDKMYSPEMLSGFLIRHMKKQAETFIGNEVNKAYITVPSHFNDAQRQSTIDAGKIAGFEEVRLLNEPTAAAIAYSTAKYSETERMILVFDFGGGTFDVSLIKFKNRDIKVIAIDGDIELGGNDVTSHIVEHYAKKFIMDHNFNTYEDARKLHKFEQICENAKIQLSDATDADITIFDLFAKDVELILQRDEFNQINEMNI